MELYEAIPNFGELTRASVQLTFDTAAQPRPFGLRSAGEQDRHLLFQAEDVCLDLRFQDEAPAGDSVLIGQLVNRQDPSESMGRIPIFLVAGKLLLARTQSNALGEFQLDFPTSGGEKLRRETTLCLLMGSDRLLEVPVSPPVDSATLARAAS